MRSMESRQVFGPLWDSLVPNSIGLPTVLGGYSEHGDYILPFGHAFG
jgi:hypothetical protein